MESRREFLKEAATGALLLGAQRTLALARAVDPRRRNDAGHRSTDAVQRNVGGVDQRERARGNASERRARRRIGLGACSRGASGRSRPRRVRHRRPPAQERRVVRARRRRRRRSGGRSSPRAGARRVAARRRSEARGDVDLFVRESRPTTRGGQRTPRLPQPCVSRRCVDEWLKVVPCHGLHVGVVSGPDRENLRVWGFLASRKGIDLAERFFDKSARF